jgi:hypothetical protein
MLKVQSRFKSVKMNDSGIIILVLSILFLIFAILVKPERKSNESSL